MCVKKKKEAIVPRRLVRKVVVEATSASGICAACTHDMCAERRVLRLAIQRVSRDRRPTLHAVRSAMGGVVCVERVKADGSMGCCKPCLGCQLALRPLDLHVRYVDEDGAWCVTR